MSFDRLRAMEVFARIVETGQMTAAAEDLGMTQPAVTRSLKALEDYLGVQLLNRSTRKLSLTKDGADFYEDAQRVLQDVAEVEARIGGHTGALTGRLRVAAPMAFGRIVLVPAIKTFLDSHPLIKLELMMSDSRADLVEQGIDIAIRAGELSDSSLRTRRVGSAQRMAVAATRYLQRSGEPKTPEALAEHNCIVFTGLATRNQWTFEKDGKSCSIRVSGNFKCSTSEGAGAATYAGIGISYHPEWVYRTGLKSGELKQVLADYSSPPVPLHAVFAADRYISDAARAFADHVRDTLAQAS